MKNIHVIVKKSLKPCQNEKGQNIFQLHNFRSLFLKFSQLPAVETDTENGAPGNFFSPSYFDMALEMGLKLPFSIHKFWETPST